jgi:hypothetical protein
VVAASGHHGRPGRHAALILLPVVMTAMALAMSMISRK